MESFSSSISSFIEYFDCNGSNTPNFEDKCFATGCISPIAPGPP